jgi:hypothetical protein
MKKTYFALALVAAFALAAPAQAKFAAAGAKPTADHQQLAKKGGSKKAPKASKSHKA